MEVGTRPFVIIEGTDGVGKTTFAEMLAAARGGIYHHTGAPTERHAKAEYLSPMIDHKFHSVGTEVTVPMIYDRWHIGEAIWPGIFGRESLYGSGEEVFIELVSLQRKMVEFLGPDAVEIIFIHRDPQSIWLELAGRGETRTQINNSLEGQKRYFDLIAKLVRQGGIPITSVRTEALPTGPVFPAFESMKENRAHRFR